MGTHFNSVIEIKFKLNFMVNREPTDDAKINSMIYNTMSLLAKNIVPTTIHIHVCMFVENNKNVYILADGHYQYISALKMAEEDIHIPITVYFSNIKTENEMQRIRYILNNPEKEEKPLEVQIEEFLLKQPLFYKTSNRRPNVNILFFMQKFKQSRYYAEINTLGDFIHFFKWMNNETKQHYSHMIMCHKTTINTKTLETCNKNNMYIGLDPNLQFLD